MAHEKVTQEKKYFVRIVKGSFHQGNTSIFSTNSVGKQCVPNCAIAALYTSIIPLHKWTSDILDNILKCGDKLYNDINSGNDFLQVHEIGKEITMYNKLYAFQIRHEYFGQIHNQSALDTINMTLEKATCCALRQNKKCPWIYCILCVGNQNGATASLLCLSVNTCYIFDPHSRNSHGQPVSDGTSVLMMFKNRQNMISYLHNLYCLSKYPTGSQNELPTDIYSMCHIDFHMIKTGLNDYFLDQHYFAFCSRTDKAKIDTKNSKSKVLQNDYRERFVSQTVPHKRKRNKAKENRHKERHRIKEKRETIQMIERQKRNEAREKHYKVSAKHKVLQNDFQDKFISDTVPSKTKRDRVKENRHKKRDRIKERRENI